MRVNKGKKIKTVTDDGFKLITVDTSLFNYQKELTIKLDGIVDSEFNQEVINEIVLWKINRYAKVEENTLEKINRIKSQATSLDLELTRDILKDLLNTRGIQLAMASTILRYKNPKIYQIIDQRVYRIIYTDQELNNVSKNIESQIDLYIKYLSRLREVSNNLGILFEESDRILYIEDKLINKDIPLKNYGSRRAEL